MLNSGELAERSPVLANMIENTGRRFIIVESVDRASDNRYYRDKLDELYSAVKVTCKHAKSAFNHPLLDMAKYSYQIVQMQKSLKIEASTKEAQQEATLKDLDVAKQCHCQVQAALQECPQAVADAEHLDAEGTENAAVLIRNYLRASQTGYYTCPTHFDNAFMQLEDAKRRLQDILNKLDKLRQDIRRRSGNIPKVELEREIQSIIEQGDDEGLGPDVPEELEQRPLHRWSQYHRCTLL